MGQQVQNTYYIYQQERQRNLDLIQKLEKLAREQPKLYQRKLKMLMALGFVVFGVILGAGLVVMVLWAILIFSRKKDFGLYLLIMFAYYNFALIYALFAPPPKPEGTPLDPSKAPKLFQLIQELGKQLKAPPMHQVLLTDQFNAMASATPRLGVFGIYRYTLSLGLPYMMVASPEEFRATLAHEFGHFSGHHTRFGARVYRLNVAWGTLQNIFGRQWYGVLVNLFLKWYVPLFEAYSFALRRQNEYEADAVAVQVSGAQANAQDLMRFFVQGRWVQEDFWQDVFRRVGESPEPTPGTFEKLRLGLKKPISTKKAKGWLKEAFKLKTGYSDTHPSLADRLKAFNGTPQLENEQDWDELAAQIATPPPSSAAEEFLGPEQEFWIKRIEKDWQASVAEFWRVRYQEETDKSQVLAQYANSQNPSELLLAGKVLVQTGTFKDAAPLMERVLDLDPQNYEAHYFLGHALLDKNDPKAEEHLQIAAEHAPTLASQIYGTLFQFFERLENQEKAEKYFYLSTQHQQVAQKIDWHIQYLRAFDQFEVRPLESAFKNRLLEQVRARSNIEAVYSVNKVLSDPKGFRIPMVLVWPKYPWVVWNTKKIDLQVIEILQKLDVPLDSYLVVIQPTQKWLKKKLDKIPQARIF